MEFKQEATSGLQAMTSKILDKSPLKYPLVRNLVCLDPRKMHSEPDACVSKMKNIVHSMVHAKILSEGLIDGEHVIREMQDFLDTEARDEQFKDYDPSISRIDRFLSSHMEKYEKLWQVCRNLLILPHGQAAVERGFSVNKEVLQDNQHQDTVVAQRIVYDAIQEYGGPLQVPITKDMLKSASAARMRYRNYLEENQRKKLSEEKKKKRHGR